VPFGCSDIRRDISHTEASDIAADLLSIDHRTVPKPVVAHRAFHGKFVGVPVHDHKNELALRHRSTPETEICSPVDGTRAAPLSAQCFGLLFFKIRRQYLLGFGEQSRNGGPLFVVNVEL
jgi:hypothetical protein